MITGNSNCFTAQRYACNSSFLLRHTRAEAVSKRWLNPSRCYHQPTFIRVESSTKRYTLHYLSYFQLGMRLWRSSFRSHHRYVMSARCQRRQVLTVNNALTGWRPTSLTAVARHCRRRWRRKCETRLGLPDALGEVSFLPVQRTPLDLTNHATLRHFRPT